MKLPRKLKKKLKTMLLNHINGQAVYQNGVPSFPEWKSSEVKIDSFGKYTHSYRIPELSIGRKSIKSFRLLPK